MTSFPVHALFDGPIVMIGFGSIGRGTLPLLERHIQFDRTKFVVIDPVDTHRGLLDERGLKFIKVGLTKANFREVLTPLLKADGDHGTLPAFLVPALRQGWGGRAQAFPCKQGKAATRWRCQMWMVFSGEKPLKATEA